jgi:hypothetical protein
MFISHSPHTNYGFGQFITGRHKAPSQYMPGHDHKTAYYGADFPDECPTTVVLDFFVH